MNYTGHTLLIRTRFDDAVDWLADKAIDLQHIDGRPGTDDAKHDLEW